MKSFRNEFQACSLFGPMTSRRWMTWPGRIAARVLTRVGRENERVRS